jgi:hypothetical protein
VRLPPVKTSATVPQKLPALKRKYPNGAWKPLKPLANCCLCRLSCFTLKSLAYERLQQRIHTCRLQYPTSLSMANGGIGFVAQAEVAEATPGWSAAEKSVPGAVRHSHWEITYCQLCFVRSIDGIRTSSASLSCRVHYIDGAVM